MSNVLEEAALEAVSKYFLFFVLTQLSFVHRNPTEKVSNTLPRRISSSAAFLLTCVLCISRSDT